MENKYELFQEWLDKCPVKIISYDDYSDLFEVTFHVPLEKEE